MSGANSRWGRLRAILHHARTTTLTAGRSLCFLFAAASFALPAAGQDNSFVNLDRSPDNVSITSEAGATALTPTRSREWRGGGVTITTRRHGGGLEVMLSAPGVAIKNLQLRWKTQLPPDWQYLGDAWERAYGDLEWKPLDPRRNMPWYFLATNGKLTHGYGVKTGPAALCHWTADATGITLHADVRCGGEGVQLGRRQLAVCTVVCRHGRPGESPFAADCALCRQMCPKPRLPREPVYGFNDWYCSYGHDTAEEFLSNTAYVVSLSPKNGNPPFAVVDDGWQVKRDLGGTNGPGPWNRTNPKFSRTLTMPRFVQRVRAVGARPGVWVRPLQASPDQPMEWRLARDPHVLDPSVPEVRAYVRRVIARLHHWGFELIKHDYTTEDITGLWGFQMKDRMLADGWAFADRTRTTAEIMRGLYFDIRQAAGHDTIIIGCNTIGHLAAGIFELQRIGDDTSGQDWARTRKMGVNCLAFRAPQHGAFFDVDADCAGQVRTDSVPWHENRQWLELLAYSGTPLFVSFPRQTVRPEQERALRAALAAASLAQPTCEPLDWLQTLTPFHWRLGNGEVTFSW
jgi:alpha-galactosidase